MPERSTIATLRGLSVRNEALVASAGSTTNPPSPVLCDRTDGWRWLNVVPGTGWDNLVNEERGPTVTTDAYSKCLRSVDGRFLVPDGMTVEFTKSSQVDLTSEVVDSMSTYKSLTASSVNSATDIGYSYFHINGDFSFEKESLRQKSVSRLTRV
ncbi:unnamed protein product [Dicrocoelium dendriticum]|nr:unnamed protein product [Dicrocoelium dendriticum]